jgi:opacity protein-like surface antigen
MKTNYLLAILMALTTASSSSFASIEVANNLLFSAFGSTSVTQSDNKTPLFINREITDKTCYDCDTTLGLQLDYHFLNNFSSSIQVLKAPQDEWSKPQIEWLYAGYEYKQFSTKIGKLRIPIFMDSEYAYVAHAFISVRPPQEVYDSIFGITSYAGANFTWNQELSDHLSLAVAPYMSFSGKHKAEKGDNNYNFEVNKMLGIAFDLSSINYRIHFTGSYADYNYSINNSPTLNDSLMMYSLGGEYSLTDWQLKSEVYADDVNTLNWYAQAAYNYKIVTPYISYGHKYQQLPKVMGIDFGKEKSHSITTGIRFDVTANISINTEYQYTKVDQSNQKLPIGYGQFTKAFVLGESKDANLYTLMVNFIL